jgi:hypothetical protein
MTDFILPDGSVFDVEVGLVNQPNPAFEGYERFLGKVKDRLARYGLRPSKIDHSVNEISARVGDDEIGVSTNPVYPAAKLVVYEDLLGMKTSESDTSINPRFGNYAEDLVIVPDGYEQTYHYAQQTSNYKDMSFLDVPKLRLAIDIRPGRMQHSSTNDGKAGMLGSRLAWIPVNAPTRCTWEVFNLYQDLNLGLIRDSKFPYLPTALGGYGKPIPFGHPPNFEAFCVRYKQGTHAGLAREFVRRTIKRFADYTVTNRYSIDPVLSAVSRIQSSWHDWVKGKSLYAPTCWLEAPPEVARFRVAKHGEDVLVDGVLKRLQGEGYLVSENDLAIAYEHNLLCKSLLAAETHEEFMEKRKESRDSWLKGSSTFSLRMIGAITPLGVDVGLQHPLKDHEYDQFWFNITSRKLNLRAFLRQENFYSREAKDFVYLNGPMKVRIPLYPQITQMGRRGWFEPTKDEQNDLSSPEEFEGLLEWVKNPVGVPPKRRTVEDDPFIIREISLDPGKGYCIVTDDTNLCRKAYNETRSWIVRIPVKWYYMAMYYQDVAEPWESIVSKKYPFYEWRTILDDGSITSYEEIGFRDGTPKLWPSVREFKMQSASIRNGRRVRVKADEPDSEENPDWKPSMFPEAYIFAPDQFLGKKRHGYRYGWA